MQGLSAMIRGGDLSNEVQIIASSPHSSSASDHSPPALTPTTSPASNSFNGDQFEMDKKAIYKHPLFPLLALLFEKCELATVSMDSPSSESFNSDVKLFIRQKQKEKTPFLSENEESNELMIKALQVLRIHLLELEKVQELCKDFCNRYITCLKGKMQSENLLRADYGGGYESDDSSSSSGSSLRNPSSSSAHFHYGMASQGFTSAIDEPRTSSGNPTFPVLISPLTNDFISQRPKIYSRFAHPNAAVVNEVVASFDEGFFCEDSSPE